MSNRDIYSILSSKPHNPHYLKRYFKFICSKINKNITGDRHHICPKSSDLFPQFASFKDNPWNIIYLTIREHYIAHMLLWKAYGGKQSQAFMLLSGKNQNRNSKIFEQIKNEMREFLKNNNPNKDGKQIRQQWEKDVDGKRSKIQSEAATKRNIEYWETRKNKISEFTCGWCGKSFYSNSKSRKFCGKSCSAKNSAKVRLFG